MPLVRFDKQSKGGVEIAALPSTTYLRIQQSPSQGLPPLVFEDIGNIRPVRTYRGPGLYLRAAIQSMAFRESTPDSLTGARLTTGQEPESFI